MIDKSNLIFNKIYGNMLNLPQDNRILKFQETIFVKIINMQDRALVYALKDFAKKKANTTKSGVNLILLDEYIAEEIIRLGIREYIKNNQERKEKYE